MHGCGDVVPHILDLGTSWR